MMRHFARLAASFWIMWVALTLVASPARAQAIIGALPNNIANGQSLDATKVMANFNAIVAAVNANAAHNGVNGDITTMTGLATLQVSGAITSPSTIAARATIATGGVAAGSLNVGAVSGTNSANVTGIYAYAIGFTTPLNNVRYQVAATPNNTCAATATFGANIATPVTLVVQSKTTAGFSLVFYGPSGNLIACPIISSGSALSVDFIVSGGN